ncbi:hypothetical protein [Streptacidiphilus sp. EB103A]|uniref:hypothetical protein n=1 Tax=Streptacidiphilus sp. EB103A TaxID=3156275 RepID=UPI0035169074
MSAHQHSHDLTPHGHSVEPAQSRPPQAPATTALEGVIVHHTGTTQGSFPHHADHPLVRAALISLNPLRPATLSGTDPADNPTARGFLVEPRETQDPGQAHIAVYWLDGGSHREQDGSVREAEVLILANKLRASGWVVQDEPHAFVIAHTPPVLDPDTYIRYLLSRMDRPEIRRNPTALVEYAQEVIRLATL